MTVTVYTAGPVLTVTSSTNLVVQGSSVTYTVTVSNGTLTD